MKKNLLKKWTLLVALYLVNTLTYSTFANQNKTFPLNIEKLTWVSGYGPDMTLAYAFTGEKLKYIVTLTNDKAEAFEGQWGIAIGKYSYDRDIPTEIESVVYESNPFELTTGESMTDTIFTNKLPNPNESIAKYIFPVIKTKSGEWQVDQTRRTMLELYNQPEGLMTDNFVAPDNIDRGAPFEVYAPIEYRDDEAKDKRGDQIVLYQRVGAIGRFTFEWEKVCTISESKEGDIYTCRVPTFIAPGTYKLTIASKDAPNEYTVSNPEEDYTHYAPKSGSNRYAYSKNIAISDKECIHNIKLTKSLEVPTANASYIELMADYMNCDSRSFYGRVVTMLIDEKGEQIEISPYPYLNETIYPKKEDSKLIKCNIESLINFEKSFKRIPDGTYKLMLMGLRNGKVQKIESMDSTIIDEVTVTIRSTTGIQNSAESNDKVHVFPNPVTDILNIEQGNQIMVSATLFDTTGKLIQTIGSENHKMDMSGLAKGIYILKVKTDKGTNTLKINKK